MADKHFGQNMREEWERFVDQCVGEAMPPEAVDAIRYAFACGAIVACTFLVEALSNECLAGVREQAVDIALFAKKAEERVNAKFKKEKKDG